MRPIEDAWYFLKADLGQPFRRIKHRMARNTPERVFEEARRYPPQTRMGTPEEAEEASADFMSREMSDAALREALETFTPEHYFHNIPPEYQGFSDRVDSEGRILRPPTGLGVNSQYGPTPFIHSQRRRGATNYDVGINPDARFPMDERQAAMLEDIGELDEDDKPPPLTEASMPNEAARDMRYYRA